ncbi:MAG: gluconokinase [Deltaproteobacteria bacterium]|nr:gluconokinase [Deltaproteobacteria bacterium]
MSSMINDLRNPSLLPDDTKEVFVVQTHISVVFIADEFVYKIKKPVNFGFLDFSSLEKRKHYCHQEVNLNRRLAKDIYLDVLPVIFDGKRHSLKAGQGKIVDYAVKMRRIPEEMLMKSFFHKGMLQNTHLKRIAEVLGNFHLKAKRSNEIDQFGRPEKFKVNTDENFEQIERFVGSIVTKDDYDALRGWTDNFYSSNKDLFYERIDGGKIRDCHGDLHMEHICLTEDLPVLDCIEFNDRFRYSDVIADIAFLLMDLEYNGGNSFSEVLWRYYMDKTGEKNIDRLLIFYKVYRSIVRGKVNSFQLDDEGIESDKKEEAGIKAARYFRLARSYI